MIRYFTPEAEALLRTKENTFGAYEVKIYNQYQTYGLDNRLLDIWTLEQDGALCGFLSRLDGIFTLCGAADPQEAAAFLRTAGGCRLFADGQQVRALSPMLDGVTHTASILRRTAPPAPHCPDPAVEMRPANRLQQAYELLCRAMPDFAATVNPDAWLVEASHKRRHQLGEYYILYVKNEPISTASILFRGQGQALLGGIATAPEARGKGYGGQLTTHVADLAMQAGESPALFAREQALCAFYAPLGFFPDGEWGEIRWN